MRRGFINSRIWNSEATAFLIDEGRFIKLGTNEEITKLTGADELIDLNGMFVVPGFVVDIDCCQRPTTKVVGMI